jgi:hypothetical protein
MVLIIIFVKNMKKLIFSALLILSFVLIGSSQAKAYVRVGGYFRRSAGTYVMPHYRSNYDHYKFNNYSSRGNYNPFTGKRGYKKWY